MLHDVVLADLKTIYGIHLLQPTQENTPRDRITKDDMERWSTLTGAPRSALCDQIAIYLARGFHNSELTFEFCDAIVNDIFGIVTSVEGDWSDLFYQVYCAFDEGEYEHRGRPDEDPVEVYTRPYITQIVAGLPSSN
jgi:hypothetical protein